MTTTSQVTRRTCSATPGPVAHPAISQHIHCGRCTVRPFARGDRHRVLTLCRVACFFKRIAVDEPPTRKTELTGLLPDPFQYLSAAKEQKEHVATSSQVSLQTSQGNCLFSDFPAHPLRKVHFTTLRAWTCGQNLLSCTCPNFGHNRTLRSVLTTHECAPPKNQEGKRWSELLELATTWRRFRVAFLGTR